MKHESVLNFLISITDSQSGIDITLTKNLDEVGFFSFRIDYLNSQILEIIDSYKFKLINVTPHKLKSALDITLFIEKKI